MAQKSIGIIMNGASGRMGYRQHLVRSILAIRPCRGPDPAPTLNWPYNGAMLSPAGAP